MRKYLARRSIAAFSIDVDSSDWRTKSPDRIVANVRNGLLKSGGGIILFHDIHEQTARALPRVLKELKEHNLQGRSTRAEGANHIQLRLESSCDRGSSPSRYALPPLRAQPPQTQLQSFNRRKAVVPPKARRLLADLRAKHRISPFHQDPAFSLQPRASCLGSTSEPTSEPLLPGPHSLSAK